AHVLGALGCMPKLQSALRRAILHERRRAIDIGLVVLPILLVAMARARQPARAAFLAPTHRRRVSWLQRSGTSQSMRTMCNGPSDFTRRCSDGSSLRTALPIST